MKENAVYKEGIKKIIEEAPARHLTSLQKKGLREDAEKLASSMKYLNAGTVEFLVPAAIKIHTTFLK